MNAGAIGTPTPVATPSPPESELGRIGVRVGLVGLAVAAVGLIGWATAGSAPDRVEIEIRFSHYQPAQVVVAAGVPVTFVLHNGDPIDHEWIVGDDATHTRHRTGTEPAHGNRPTEVTIPAGATISTTVVFDAPGRQAFICHLPGHEAYGMVGTVVIAG